MKLVKLGKFNLPEYAAKKPVGIRGNGDLIYATELLNESVAPSFGLLMASEENKTKLAIERIKLEPDFDYGVLDNGGKYSKSDVLKHIQEQTPLGMEFANIEVAYAEYFSNQLMGNEPVIEKSTSTKTAAKEEAIPKDWNLLPDKLSKLIKTRVLFCENTTNNVTKPCADYRIKNVHPEFVKRGFDVISLTDASDTRAFFQAKATNALVVYIGGVGHGNYSRYTGDNFDPILQVGSYNSTEVKDKVIHFLSCQTGKTLGPDTVTHGAKAYAGYYENFVFDWANADLYWQCDSQFDISMANGKTVEQAVADTMAKYNAAIASLPGTNTAATLLNDRNIFRTPVSGAAWGNKTAKISPNVSMIMSFAEFAAR